MPSAPDMTERDDELADLEAERDRLKSLIALYARPEIGFPELPGWFGYVLVGVVGLVGIYVAVEMLTGQIEPSLVLPFDPKLFGKAANNGQMIFEVNPKAKAAEGLAAFAQQISRREVAGPVKSKSLFDRLVKRG